MSLPKRFTFVLSCCAALVARPLAAQEDATIVRYAQNPLLTKGAPGAIDDLKIGPRAMLREGPNDWKMWYEAVPDGNKSFTAYATSSDGLAWTRYGGNPVMSPSESWEGGVGNATGEVSPISVLKEHGLYKLWYHGFSGSITRQIGYATSPDGVTWTKYAGNPVLAPGTNGAWDQDSICEGNVLHVGDEYLMYYSHCAGNGGIGLATSPDGISWTKYAGNPVIGTGSGWEDQQVDWSGLYHDGQRFHMWYLGRNSSPGGFELGYAYSDDGRTFTKSSQNPVLPKPNPLIISTDYAVNKGDGIGVENSAKIFRRGAEWWIYYGGFASCCPEDATLSLGKAPVQTSPNRAPVVDAGADQTIASGPATLDGTVQDDDTPVTLDQVTATWSQVCGPGTATFSDANAIDTSVSFDASGTYVLELSADDSAASGSATVTVTVGQASTGCESAGSGGTSGGGTSSGGNSSGGATTAGSSNVGGSGNGVGGTTASGGSSGAGSIAGSSNAAGGASGASGGSPANSDSNSGCGCRTSPRSSSALVLLAALGLALGALRARPRRQIRGRD